MARTRKSRKADHLKETLADLESGDGARLRARLVELHPADIAKVLIGLPPEHRAVVWKETPVDKMGEALLEAPEAVRTELLAMLDDPTLVAAVRTLDTDDIADLIPELSDELITEILLALDKQDRQRLDAILSYPEDTAGGLMNTDAVTVRENITVEVVLRYLRRRDELPEHTNSLFVVDRADRLVGVVSVAKLLTSDAPLRVSQVMEREVIRFPVLAPDTEVATAFERYNLLSAPVVDETGRLLGRITIDDVVDVMREQAERAMLNRAGLREPEDLFAGVWHTVKNRWTWVAVNLVTALVASRVIGIFEGTIERLVALASLMPIVAGIGGNAGNQTVTMIVRALVLGQINESSMRALILKEIRVGIANGLLWGGLLGVIAYALYNNVALGLVMTAAMTLNLLLAACAGVLVPLMRYRLGRDPARGSSVLITAITDSGGFFIFLGLATIFLL